MGGGDIPHRLFILTGDYSGDMHAANVVKSLHEMQPQIELAAVGGQNLQAEGVQLVSDQSKMGRVGSGSILGAPYHYFLGRRILKFLDEFKPDAVLLIDYGVFNLYMAKQIKKRGIKVFYFIPPQVWASRKGRIRKIKASVDHVFCIFPFEEKLYQSHDIPVTYVGHPLAGKLPPPVNREAFCRENGLKLTVPIVGLFPGSRKMEIDYLLKPIISSVPLIQREEPHAEFVLAKAGSLDSAFFQKRLDEALQSVPHYQRPKVTVVENQNHALLSIADVVVLASGTVTLEAALYRTPMVIIYKLQPIIYQLALLMIYLPCMGLPNILTDMKHPIVPELWQDEANAQAIAKSVKPLFDPTTPQWIRQKSGFDQIRRDMSVGDATANVARAILSLLAGHSE